MPRLRWTEERCAILRERYPHESTAALAKLFGVTTPAVYMQAGALGLKKTAAYLAQYKEQATAHLRTLGEATRLKKGQVPWNKGKQHKPTGGALAHQFKPGQRPHTWRPIGTERETKEGYLERKVAETGKSRRDYKPVHHLVWFAAGREIPPGCALAFRDGNKRNFDLTNLELLTRKELMARNSYHNYGPEVAALVQLRGAITRQINKKEKARNEQ
jgi:hypothetical protein